MRPDKRLLTLEMLFLHMSVFKEIFVEVEKMIEGRLLTTAQTEFA